MKVRHLRLVLKGHQRHDVAGRRQISGGTKSHHQLLQIFGRGWVGRDCVGAVALFARARR